MPEETKTETGATQTEQKVEAKFTQADLDRVVAERLAREGVKREELEELRKFKIENEKQAEQATQAELEKQKEYEKLKEAWNNEKNQYQQTIAQKEQAIKDMNIDTTLTGEVFKQGLYPEAKDLLKSVTVFDETGQVRIKGKDASGIGDTLLSVEEGIKQFKEDKPYLVRATSQGGAGTASGETAGGSQRGTDPLADAKELEAAKRSGDRTRITEARKRIQNKWAETGISPTNI